MVDQGETGVKSVPIIVPSLCWILCEKVDTGSNTIRLKSLKLLLLLSTDTYGVYTLSATVNRRVVGSSPT